MINSSFCVGPSPDDEENSSEKLSNSRRLPPRPKRRLKKTEPASDSEEENAGKSRRNASPRPTPLPRKQKLMKENDKEGMNVRNTFCLSRVMVILVCTAVS